MTRPLAFLSLLSLTACGLPPAEDDAPVGETQEEVKSHVSHPAHGWFACAVDSDCVAVPRAECCGTGWKEAVNKHHVKAYEHSITCPKHQICPLYVIDDTRVAECNNDTGKCEMIDPAAMSCGGFVRNHHECAPGYSCEANAKIPDLPGKCVKGCVQNVACLIYQHFDHNSCQCVDNPSCGGIAGRACPHQYPKCIDDPRDGCDPGNGGADCLGICTP